MNSLTNCDRLYDYVCIFIVKHIVQTIDIISAKVMYFLLVMQTYQNVH